MIYYIVTIAEFYSLVYSALDSYHNTKTMKAINHIHYSFPSIFLATISVSIEEEQQKQTVNERLSKVWLTLQTNICQWSTLRRMENFFSVLVVFSPFVIWKVKFWYLAAGNISQAEHFTDMTET